MITKCANELNEESIAKRLRNLEGQIKKQKPGDTLFIEKIFDSIISKGHYYIGRKASGKEEI